MMKAHQVRGGRAVTLRVQPVEGPFVPVPVARDEVQLVATEGKSLLVYASQAVLVVGVSREDEVELIRVAAATASCVTVVARADAQACVLEVRSFSQALVLGEPLRVAVDDKALDDIRKVGVGGSLVDVLRWLEDHILLPPAARTPDSHRRVVATGEVASDEGSFRLLGSDIAVDVKRVAGVLRVERATRGGRANRRELLVSGALAFVDGTRAAEATAAARTDLERAVAESSSYLAVWERYNALERQSTERRASAFGALEYVGRQRDPRTGRWVFELREGAALIDPSVVSEDESDLTLAATEEVKVPSAATDLARGDASSRRRRPWTGSVIQLDVEKRRVELLASDERDATREPPPCGYLSLAQAGDHARQRRRERAEEALRVGRCPMPQLGLLMEGRPAPALRLPRRSALSAAVGKVFGASGPTQRQREALDLALNTPDICLIQGPPGTGKTKVITALERRLAELPDEGAEVTHRVLVTAAQHDAVENVAARTEVFGLPAFKVGHRRGEPESDFDLSEGFSVEQAERLRATLPEPLDAERLIKARQQIIACVRLASSPAEHARRILAWVDGLGELLAPPARDRARERAAALTRPTTAGDPEEAELLLRAARGIRVGPLPFADDGPTQAAKALKRLQGVLTEEERAFLEACAACETGEVPAGLDRGVSLREGLIDRLTPAPAPLDVRLDQDTQKLLFELLDEVEKAHGGRRTGADAAVAAFLEALEGDPEGVHQTIGHYTAVLAATLQHAAAKPMRSLRGVTQGDAPFVSVIVDEAARAHPLDLFIPLSLASRRVVLVGDHRQLPHLLEPDVERELAENVRQGSVSEEVLAAVKESLFQRLWDILKGLEQRDGIRRTVTLDAQYRMHPELGDFVSRTFYEHHGDARVESPRPASEFAHDLPGYVGPLGPRAAAWIDVPRERGPEMGGRSKRRPAEARVIAKEVRRLAEADPSLSFGVIAFYADQVDELNRALAGEGLVERGPAGRGWQVADGWRGGRSAAGRPIERLRVGTVDAFQGREFDVVLLSITRSNDLPGESAEQQRRKFGHLMLDNRLCVAMSRQQRLLIAVGDRAFVRAAAGPLRALHAFEQLCGGSP